MKSKAKYRILLIMAITVFVMGYYQKNTRERETDLVSTNHENISLKSITNPDKTLLIGEWSKTGTPYLIKIAGLLDTGKLEVAYYNPNYYEPANSGRKIEIEKANWTKTGTLLSVYIELQDADYPGSNFKLN